MHTPDTRETPEQLVLRLHDAPYGRAWWHAVEHLAWHGAAAVPALIGALAAEQPSVREAAAWALGQIGPAARPATRALLDRLFDESPEVRNRASNALANIAPPLRAALPLLLGRLAAEENRGVQRSLLRILGHVGPAARDALPLISPRLDDEDLFDMAVYALRSIAPDDPRLLRALYAQLTTPRAPFRALAAEAAGRMRLSSPEWIEALAAASQCADANVRHAARGALRKIEAARR